MPDKRRGGNAPYLMTYVTYSLLHPNAKPDLSYLISTLKKYKVGDLALILSKLNIALSEQMPTDRPDIQHNLAAFFFDDYILTKLRRYLSKSASPDICFHRHQLLFLMKLAFQYCDPGKSVYKWSVHDRHFLGKCLLLSNDFLSLYKGTEEHLNNLSEEDKKKILLKEFIPTYEINIQENLGLAICRMRIIFRVIFPKTTTDPNFIDIDSVLAGILGFSFEKYMYLIFSIIALYGERRKSIWDDATSIYINKDNFLKGTRINGEQFEIILALISQGIESYQKDIFESRDHLYDFSFISFRKFPLIKEENDYYCIDMNFLLDKLSKGLFWLINNHLDTSDSIKFHRYWGSLFEKYITFLLLNSDISGKNMFFPNPKAISSNDELVDGLMIFGDNIVLMEYKYAQITQESKYSASYEHFYEELRNKLEKNVEGKPKGYGQLANAINKIFSANSPNICVNINKGNVRIIYPLLIIYDDYYNSPLMNEMLNNAFTKLIDHENIISGIEIKPLIIMGIGDFEKSLSFITHYDVMLQERIIFDPKMQTSFSDYLNNKTDEIKKPKILSDEYALFRKDISEFIFGKIT